MRSFSDPGGTRLALGHEIINQTERATGVVRPKSLAYVVNYRQVRLTSVPISAPQTWGRTRDSSPNQPVSRECVTVWQFHFIKQPPRALSITQPSANVEF